MPSSSRTSEGEICVKGPNVFNGYLGNPRSAFIEIDGARWYRTGDIGHLDEENYLIISGRLKRFTKIGGEMISLGAIEEAINAELIRRKRISPDVPSLALCADEKESGKPQLILFTTLRSIPTRSMRSCARRALAASSRSPCPPRAGNSLARHREDRLPKPAIANCLGLCQRKSQLLKLFNTESRADRRDHSPRRSDPHVYLRADDL